MNLQDFTKYQTLLDSSLSSTATYEELVKANAVTFMLQEYVTSLRNAINFSLNSREKYVEVLAKDGVVVEDEALVKAS